MIHDVLVPFVMGVLLIGAMTERTITVLHGNIKTTALYSLLISAVYWFNIQYVASGNIVAYCAFSVGTLLVTCAQAWREKRHHARQSSASEQSKN